ncbi:PqiC family protein [Methylomonas lenta]|nr:PqiC family protein [Methylomonas lenta]
MFNKYSIRFIVLCVSGLLSACASSPPTHFYTLESQSRPPATTTSAIAKKPLIGIGPLSLPALLDRNQIVTRTEDSSIQLAEFDQWAAPLKDNVIAVLSENVSILQPNAIVRAYPWSIYGNVDYRVIIDITRFDTQLGKWVNLEASWVIMEETTLAIISNGQVKLQSPLNDASYNTVVQELSKLLGEFSQQISLSLVQVLQRPRNTDTEENKLIK